MSDIILVVFGLVLGVVGLIGSVLPILPGAPLAWIGLLLYKLSEQATYAWWVVWLFLILSLAGIAMDYLIPGWGAKKMGGSKYGVRGTFVGLFVGIIFAPFGGFSLIVCPFLGALIGELLYNSNNQKRAFKAAFGSFLGFLTTTGYGIFISSIMLSIIVYSFMNGVGANMIENTKELF